MGKTDEIRLNVDPRGVFFCVFFSSVVQPENKLGVAEGKARHIDASRPEAMTTCLFPSPPSNHCSPYNRQPRR